MSSFYKGKILKRNFYNRPTLEVAKDLLGCFIVRKIKGKGICAMITDVEAYIGEEDLACHASKGRTKRTEVLYGKPGHAYVYLIYGMYYIVNFVTQIEGFPAAVMIRGVKIEGVDCKKTNGPGKVCREMKIDRSLHNWDITKGEEFWIQKGARVNAKDIHIAKRIGIAYAKHCAHYPWRFYIKNLEEREKRTSNKVHSL